MRVHFQCESDKLKRQILEMSDDAEKAGMWSISSRNDCVPLPSRHRPNRILTQFSWCFLPDTSTLFRIV
jgi:hypothetical protein